MAKNSKSANKIGIFDSGVGGLTVMRAIQTLLPNEEILYYADTAHLPYGNKSPEEILGYLSQAITFFSAADVKLLVIACHTACAVGLNYLRSLSPIPIIAILEQGIEQLIQHTPAIHIAILATEITISSGVYQRTIETSLPHTKLTTLACPQFVPLIEEGFISHPLTQLAIHETLKPLKSHPLDAVLLGCTHYPLIKPSLEQELGKPIALLDPAERCAQATFDYLARHSLFNTTAITPQHNFHITANPDKFHKLCSLFLGTRMAPSSL